MVPLKFIVMHNFKCYFWLVIKSFKKENFFKKKNKKKKQKKNKAKQNKKNIDDKNSDNSDIIISFKH